MNRREAYAEYLQSNHWLVLRQMKFRQVGHRCQLCGFSKTIQVHHINYHDLTDCTVDDLLVICESCHGIIHCISKATGQSLKGLGVKELRVLMGAGTRPKKQFMERKKYSRKEFKRMRKEENKRRRKANFMARQRQLRNFKYRLDDKYVPGPF